MAQMMHPIVLYDHAKYQKIVSDFEEKSIKFIFTLIQDYLGINNFIKFQLCHFSTLCYHHQNFRKTPKYFFWKTVKNKRRAEVQKVITKDPVR